MFFLFHNCKKALINMLHAREFLIAVIIPHTA
jgi:hypothetical protein